LLLASSPTATWLGQDGHDLAGGNSSGAGNGVQDIHVLLSGLPASDPISAIDVTAYGGGEWRVNFGSFNMYSGVLIQAAGATTAGLYLDPYQNETGRAFSLAITYDDGSTCNITMQGGTANANLWMPGDAVTLNWLGQDGTDLTSPTPDVGPNGFQDVHVALAHLYSDAAISAVTVLSKTGQGWSYGLNPALYDNAEFVRNAANATQGDLYFSPIGNMKGQILSITVTYADGKAAQTPLTASTTNPTLRMPAVPPVSVNWNTITATWLGQDGLNLVGPGDVDLALSGIPAGRTVESATLSNESGSNWTYLNPGSGHSAPDPYAGPLGFRIGSNPTTANLTFPPVRNETGATLTLLLRLDDGTYVAAHVAGGAANPGLRQPQPAASMITAYPGDDLNALANTYGTITLVAGTYPMSVPLVLNQPVTILAEPGATLLFSQSASAPTWTAAIKVRSSHTTLEGFAVRFSGPIRWTSGIAYGPAVIGTTDNFDPPDSDPCLDLTFSHLDLEAPPASTSWEEAPELLRLANAESGQITDNQLKGGATEFFGGPWQVTGNAFLGTLPDTYTYDAFAMHYTHDVTIAGNTVAPVGPTGKTWRFLVMTENGIGDTVENNTVVGVGPMDDDTVVNPNAPEIILSEAYTLHYEGMVGSVSTDGTMVQIPTLQYGAARTGDVLAILSGPQAGQWRLIAQVVNPTTYLLNAPIAPGSFAVSIATGFVNETYQGNTIDARGSSVANDLVLAGNQFGARILNNTFLGGKNAFQLTAYPSEAPNIWGWTHSPFLGATIAGNTIEDSLNGGVLDVLHNPYSKSDAGRVYFSGTFTNNTGVWDAAFLAARAQNPAANGPPVLVTLGDSLSADPGELVLTASGNSTTGPSTYGTISTLQIVSATVNGVAYINGVAVPAARAVVRLAPRSAPAKVATPPKTTVKAATAVNAKLSASAAPAPLSPSFLGPMTQTDPTASQPAKARSLPRIAEAPSSLRKSSGAATPSLARLDRLRPVAIGGARPRGQSLISVR
jgi:hypothetical protein